MTKQHLDDLLVVWYNWFNSCRAQFISGNIDQYFHSRQIVDNQGAQVSENFPREYKDPFTQQSQYYGSKFPGSGRSQDISNHDDDLVLFFLPEGLTFQDIQYISSSYYWSNARVITSHMFTGFSMVSRSKPTSDLEPNMKQTVIQTINSITRYILIVRYFGIKDISQVILGLRQFQTLVFHPMSIQFM